MHPLFERLVFMYSQYLYDLQYMFILDKNKKFVLVNIIPYN